MNIHIHIYAHINCEDLLIVIDDVKNFENSRNENILYGVVRAPPFSHEKPSCREFSKLFERESSKHLDHSFSQKCPFEPSPVLRLHGRFSCREFLTWFPTSVTL